MKFGFVLPSNDAKMAVAFAKEVEAAGWDGFFVWEPVWGQDPWVMLGACAMVTERVKLGTLLTPPSRRRPWTLANQALAVDLLSDGRTILSVGLGAVDTGFEAFGEETDRKTRAELLDESIDILTGLWSGEPLEYDGKHHTIQKMDFHHQPPPSVQQPRIPIWVVGAWRREKSMQRVLKCDGILVAGMDEKGEWYEIQPQHVKEIKAYINEHRQLDTPFDIIIENTTPGDDPKAAAEKVRPWAEAGASWWIESMWETEDENAWLERVRKGPPRL
ncbi:MAG: LLM class flavin-dependent oxidoreductase [Anaerolineales bacterium]|nr:LLM class flavin-dependent oxidoreductase [Anaerolineales bacterium]